MKVFLSHTGTDKPLVGKVQGNIPEYSWFDAVDITSGERIPEKINEGLRQSTHFALFWSQAASVAPWVNAELNAAFILMMQDKCKFLIFVLDNTELPELLAPYKYDVIDLKDLDEAAEKITYAIISQEGSKPVMSSFVNRTSELARIEDNIRNGFPIICLYGLMGIGKMALVNKSIVWLYSSPTVKRITLDFFKLPGLAELTLDLARQVEKELINENLTSDNQKRNIQYLLECASEQNCILILKDVKGWLKENSEPNENLLFIIDTVTQQGFFSYAIFMTSSRYINFSLDKKDIVMQIKLEGMNEEHITKILENNLPITFEQVPEKNRAFSQKLHGYPLAARIAASRISNDGYDCYINQPDKIQSLNVAIAKDLISYSVLSKECFNFLMIMALCKSRMRNEEYILAFPELNSNLSRLTDEAYFSGVVRYNEAGFYELESLVQDYFFEQAFQSKERKNHTLKLEQFLVEYIKKQGIEVYMRLIPVTVSILVFNNNATMAKNLRSELTQTIIASMWDQYNNREYNEAVSTAENLLLDNLSNIEAKYVKALCLIRFEKYVLAQEILDQLLAEDREKDYRYYLAVGRIAKQKNQYSEAIQYFQISIQKRKRYMSAYRELADCYLLTDEIDEAREAIKIARRLEPSNIYVLLVEVQLMQKTGLLNEALELLNSEEHLEHSRSMLLFRKGRLYDDLGKKEMAIDIYNSIIQSSETEWDAQLCLLSHTIMDDPEKSRESIENLKNRLFGKRKAILSNIEARLVGYQKSDYTNALLILDNVPAKYRDKQWFAVKLQLLTQQTEGHLKSSRNILYKDSYEQLEKFKLEISNKYRKNSFSDTDLLPDI